MSATRLYDLPLSEARALLASGAPVYLSVNPVEYHGPHLSLRNDGLVSAGLIRDMHARLLERHPGWPLILAGSLEVGVETVPGPGSQPVPFDVVCGLVRQACQTLLELGARRAVLMTFHGSPLHNLALHRGELLLRRGGVQTLAPMSLLFELWTRVGDGGALAGVFDPIADPAQRAAARAGAGLDIHAGFFETSLALHYAPRTVRGHREVPPCPSFAPDRRVAALAGLLARAGLERSAEELGFVAAAVAWYGLRPFPGYTGRPHLANPESGARLARLLAEAYAARAEEVFAGGAGPAPPLRWLAPLTLGGRIGRGLYDVWPQLPR
jgi:creatinine amidohydrolase